MRHGIFHVFKGNVKCIDLCVCVCLSEHWGRASEDNVHVGVVFHDYVGTSEEGRHGEEKESVSN